MASLVFRLLSRRLATTSVRPAHYLRYSASFSDRFRLSTVYFSTSHSSDEDDPDQHLAKEDVFLSRQDPTEQDTNSESLPDILGPSAPLLSEVEKTREPIRLNLKDFINGPPTKFGQGTLAQLAESSIVATCGQTVVLTALTAAESEEPPSDFVKLTVDYRQRAHGVGRIPRSGNRRDNARSTDLEILGGRVLDRSIRPLLKPTSETLHMQASVQSYPIFEEKSGHAVALAVNAASMALGDRLKEPVAAISICVMPDGTVIADPNPAQVSESYVELVMAATREHVLMLEMASPTAAFGIFEEDLTQLLELAHAAIQPLLDLQEQKLTKQYISSPGQDNKSTDGDSMSQKEDEEDMDDNELRMSLGLAPSNGERTASSASDEEGVNRRIEAAMEKFSEEAIEHCRGNLQEASWRLFGFQDDSQNKAPMNQKVKIHPKNCNLLSKSLRGRREQIFYDEIHRLLSERFQDLDEDCLAALAQMTNKKLLQEALWTTATKFGTRGDNRGESPNEGHKTVRPLTVTVPALPETVHGSAVFSRGETQVLCTVTLGTPNDGMSRVDPYKETKDPYSVEEPSSENSDNPFKDLPVGSLRYTRTQEALISDLNSRKIRAEKEMTGESGTLDEVQRAFLQYDFPSYSTGEVPTRFAAAANRRAIGHGALAEKAIFPVLPLASEFPYIVRMTSEVTASNGSSSMASVCGATLALLDAGVPIVAPVAGVSVGLAASPDEDEPPDASGLILDLTGTEDYYGAMDFKVAGTSHGVTALQLDVKQPLPISILADALQLAGQGRKAILKEMSSQCESSSLGVLQNLKPRPTPKKSAPRVEVVRFNPTRKRDLIGPGGAVLRQLEDRYGVSLDLTQEGQCLLFGAHRDMVDKAKSAVMDLVADVEVGGIYEGTIVEIKDFGAIVELLRNKEGLLHVSELNDDDSTERHPRGNLGVVEQYLKVGQKLEVMCIEMDPVQGFVRLSRKQLLRQRASGNDTLGSA